MIFFWKFFWSPSIFKWYFSKCFKCCHFVFQSSRHALLVQMDSWQEAAVDGTMRMRFSLPHPLRRWQCSQRDAGLHGKILRDISISSGLARCHRSFRSYLSSPVEKYTSSLFACDQASSGHIFNNLNLGMCMFQTPKLPSFQESLGKYHVICELHENIFTSKSCTMAGAKCQKMHHIWGAQSAFPETNWLAPENWWLED